MFSATSTYPARERHAPPGGERGETGQGRTGHRETGQRGARRRGREDGFTLIELVVVMALTTVVLGAMLTLLYNSQQVQAGDAARSSCSRSGSSGCSPRSRARAS